MSRNILIVGASVRAAAQSAVRAGHEVAAIDLFGDSDLRNIARVETCAAAQYPSGLSSLAARLPPAPFCYVGGLENHPNILRQIQRTRSLYGVSPAVLKRCRDPFLLCEISRRHGLAAARVEKESRSATANSRWLRKPLTSCGGTGIRFSTFDRSEAGSIFQEYISGPVYSGSFLATDTECHLLCVARQFTVRDFGNTTHAHPFAFMAAVGPVSLDEGSRLQWTEIGHVLVQSFELRGLFGVDTVWNRSHRSSPVLLEINPRFTASMELYDLVKSPNGPSSAMGMHISSFGRRNVQLPPTAEPHQPHVFGKAIVYAPVDVRFDASLVERLQSEPATGEHLSDLPVPPQTIRAGSPVLTAIVQGRSEEEVAERLGVGRQDGIVQRLQGELLRYQTKTDCSP